jgi:hypothetical protein
MTKRTKIVNALVEKFKEIDGTGPYTTNIYNNAYAKLKFWDEIQDFPSIYVTPGSETREYLPGDFTWGFLNIAIKCYVRSEDTAQEELEQLIEDIERCVDLNRVLQYDTEPGHETTEILVVSITTDEGLLVPYGVGEINLQVRYALV